MNPSDYSSPGQGETESLQWTREAREPERFAPGSYAQSTRNPGTFSGKAMPVQSGLNGSSFPANGPVPGFGYSPVQPDGRAYMPVSGSAVPPSSAPRRRRGAAEPSAIPSDQAFVEAPTFQPSAPAVMPDFTFMGDAAHDADPANNKIPDNTVWSDAMADNPYSCAYRQQEDETFTPSFAPPVHLSDAADTSAPHHDEVEYRQPDRRRSHPFLIIIMILILLAGLALGAWYFQDRIPSLQQAEFLHKLDFLNQIPFLKKTDPTPTPAVIPEPDENFPDSRIPSDAVQTNENAQTVPVVNTPEPVQVLPTPAAYEVPEAPVLNPEAREAMDALIPDNMSMDEEAVTENIVIMRTASSDGLWDHYVFSAVDGRLIAYFDNLDENAVIPQPDNTLYVKQSPYMLNGDGSAVFSDFEDPEHSVIYPMMNGWSITETRDPATEKTVYNYIHPQKGKLSALSFDRVWPFSGKYTVAYVDTGSGNQNRYLLCILDEENGDSPRWLSGPDMEDVVASVCSLVYMDNGDLYLLPDHQKSLMNTSRVDVYPDCAAFVVYDNLSGKCGLYINGTQQYGFDYDEIRPVDSDLEWQEQFYTGNGGTLVIHLSGTSYPMPSHYTFEMIRNDTVDHLLLKSVSDCPILLNLEDTASY